MKPLVFHVEVAGEFRPVELAFAAESEVRRLRNWRKAIPAADATEFAALAAKRWFYYSREGATIQSLDALEAAIRQNPRAELAFLLVASAKWASRYRFLALAYCRRTWCHHLVLDFLAVRPAISISNQSVKGLGTGMLASLAGIADSFGMETLWGEATAHSAAFYQSVLKIASVKDLFIMEREMIRWLSTSYFEGQKQRLAELTRPQHSVQNEEGLSGRD